MDFLELLQSVAIWVDAFFNGVNSGFKLFFNDLPVIYGLQLGWWFIIFSLLGIIVSKITGEGDGDDD